uniref:Reverse transcriptase domain-containing protein n=1 Tax=Tanacetum cinerariifolium TaxID=118510 RepID=A0A699H253_TANCI|nr:hypothetical protein [Tanacetum cinerariifolium]
MKRLVHGLVIRLYYYKVRSPLKSIKELKIDSDVDAFLLLGYKNRTCVDLYVEHHDYDVLDFLLEETSDHELFSTSSDEYCSDDKSEDIDGVDFHTARDHNVVIKNYTTTNPFLNRLCSNEGYFIGCINDPIPTNRGNVEENPDGSQIDPHYKIKKGISYPKHDLTMDWDKKELVLGMRFDHPEQLKIYLANYGVANGYQLWYPKNDWKSILVFCGRNVDKYMSVGCYSKMKKDGKSQLTVAKGNVTRKLFSTPPPKKTRSHKKKMKQGKGCSNVGGSANNGEGYSKDVGRKRLRPYHFTYPERRLTMEEMLYKFIEEGKREQDEMRAFIHEFRTTNELLFKERNNSLSGLMFEMLSGIIKQASIKKDPGSFNIPYDIGQLQVTNALADIGASISLMPYTMYEKLGMGEPKAIRMSLELADRSIQYPRGINENARIKVDKVVLLIDFVILYMPEDSRVPIILGKPFLATARAMIDIFNKKIMLRVGDDEVIFDMDQSIKRPLAEDDECYGVDDMDDAINIEAQELLANNMSDSFY